MAINDFLSKKMDETTHADRSEVTARNWGGFSEAQFEQLSTALHGFVAELQSDPAVQDQVGTDDPIPAIDQNQYVTGIWEETLSGKYPLNEARVRSILRKVTRHIDRARTSAEVHAESVSNFVARWKNDSSFPPALAGESPDKIRLRIVRTISGIYDFVIADLKTEFLARKGLRFAIDWGTPGGRAAWLEGGTEAGSMHQMALQSAILFGELPEDLAGQLAARILTEMKIGVMVIPHFAVSDDSNKDRLVLEWQTPSIIDEDLEEWPATAAEAELSLVQGKPELAELLDQAICLAAVKDAARPGNQAASRLRTLLQEAGTLSTEQTDTLLAMFGGPTP